MKLEVLACDFCAKTQHEVKLLVAGPKVAICDVCVDECSSIINKAREESKVGLPAQEEKGV